MVYRNAQLTIIAAAGSDPEYGLPGVGERLRPRYISESIAGRLLHVVPPDPNQRLKESTWMTRAWVYQEAIFSRRRLIFTDEQVYFDCDSMSCRESIDTNPELLQSKRRAHNFITQSVFPVLNQSFTDSYNASARTRDHIRSHIQNYSGRQLTYDSDILNGMLGIFRAYESALTDVEFKQYWGLPLLPHEKWNHPIYPKWTTRLILGFKLSLERPSRRRLGFPSWSWTGWRGKITFDHHHDFLSPDPLVVVWVECREGEKMWHEPFEDFMPRQASLKFVTPFLRVNAMTLRLRFEYLTEAPPSRLDCWFCVQSRSRLLCEDSRSWRPTRMLLPTVFRSGQ